MNKIVAVYILSMMTNLKFTITSVLGFIFFVMMLSSFRASLNSPLEETSIAICSMKHNTLN